MTESQQEVTPEQYKAQLLKQNFANRCADYEDAIASLQTQVAMLKQQLNQKGDDTDIEGVPGQSDMIDGLPPPPPVEG